MFKKDNPTKVLFLGGSYAQIPILKEARDRGYYLIICDFLPENPGIRFADEYHNVSTTDLEEVLKLALKVRPDFIIAYASDPAAPVAAYVSEKMGLPGNPYSSVRILSEKDLFRNYQRELGLNTPQFCIITENDYAEKELSRLSFPYIVKPTDSSGSKGVTKVTCNAGIAAAISYAFSFSRSKRIIAEEFIDNKLADLHGDGFVVGGELVFSHLGDHIYNRKSNPFNPIGTMWPSIQSKKIIDEIAKDAANIIKSCGFRNGPVNIEARVNSKGKPYIMEIGPRSGGHFVPQAIFYGTGFNMVKASLDVMFGKKIILSGQLTKSSAYYAIHSDVNGELMNLALSARLLPYIEEFHQYILPGKMVRSFQGANDTLGIILFSFRSHDKMNFIMSNMQDYIELEIRESVMSPQLDGIFY